MNVLLMFYLGRVSTGAGPQPATVLSNEEFHMYYSRINTASAERFL